MIGFIKELLLVLLTRIAKASNHTKYVPLNNHQCMTKPSLINLYLMNIVKDYVTVLVGSCKTLINLPNRVSVPNKVEDLNSSGLNMMTWINESKTLANIYHVNANVSLVAANVTQIKSGRTRNVGARVKMQNNIMCAKKFIF